MGHLRWRAPEPHKPRAGEQDATSFGNVCPQTQSNAEWYRTVADMFGASPEEIPPTGNIDEDCLFLNVWTTAAGTVDALPVMVWIHGGGNADGYAHEPDYHGNALAAKGVVFVSLNYRLGLLGFMAHPGLTAESPRGVSGNYGILDQLHALRWIQDNIAVFGGDPGNVTILGESAGGADIATLIASPLGEGLFQRAIIESGGYEISSFYTMAEAEATGSQVASLLEFDEMMSAAELVEGMRELDWMQFVGNPVLDELGGLRAINIDAYVLPEPKSEMFASGSHDDVEIVIGTNANESFMWQSTDATVDSFHERLAAYGEPYASELRQLLAEDVATDLQMAMDRLGSAETFLCGSRYIANHMARQGSSVYFYYFTRIRPGGEKVLAYHGAEIPYALDTAAEWLPADGIDASLTETMSQYWLNFARTGNPNGAGLPEWPRYVLDTRRHQVLGDEVTAGGDLEPGICDILDRKLENELAAFE